MPAADEFVQADEENSVQTVEEFVQPHIQLWVSVSGIYCMCECVSSIRRRTLPPRESEIVDEERYRTANSLKETYSLN